MGHDAICRVLDQLRVKPNDTRLTWREDVKTKGISCRIDPPITCFIYCCQNILLQYKTLRVDYIGAGRLQGREVGTNVRLSSEVTGLVIRAGEPVLIMGDDNEQDI